MGKLTERVDGCVQVRGGDDDPGAFESVFPWDDGDSEESVGEQVDEVVLRCMQWSDERWVREEKARLGREAGDGTEVVDDGFSGAEAEGDPGGRVPGCGVEEEDIDVLLAVRDGGGELVHGRERLEVERDPLDGRRRGRVPAGGRPRLSAVACVDSPTRGWRSVGVVGHVGEEASESECAERGGAADSDEHGHCEASGARAQVYTRGRSEIHTQTSSCSPQRRTSRTTSRRVASNRSRRLFRRRFASRAVPHPFVRAGGIRKTAWPT